MVETNNQHTLSRFVSRLTSGLAGGAAAGVLAACLDAARASSTPGGAGIGALLLPQIGLVAPLAAGLGVLGGLFAWLFLPADFPLRAGATEASAERVYAHLLVPPALALATLLLGKAALGLLAAGSSATGSLLALAALSLFTLAVAPAFGAARVLARRRPTPPLSLPVAALAGGLALVVILLLAVAAGTTSGTGHRLALFGVFRRPELDLTGPALALLPLLGGLFFPALRGARSRLLAVEASLALLGVTLWAAGQPFEAREVALSVERGAPLGKHLLGLARRVTDRDRDGFSARFGGGDCAEGDPAKNPAADDLPGNGIDEDCSGSDAKPVAIEQPQAPVAKDQVSAAREALPAKPNVILISIDTLRADLGYAGYARKVTPNLDALAAKSVIFERAYSLASYTSKSLAPMLIGKYGSETHRGWSHFNRFGKGDVFLAERLQQRGIRTVSVQGHWYFMKGYGLERGFDVLDGSAAPKAAQIEGDRTSTSDKLSDAAIRQLDEPALETQQFFMWVHYTDPHSEYVAHEGFDFGKASRDLYDSEVAFTDHHVGRVLERLAAKSFSERSIVVITSDHGEAFGEHGMIRHGFELWEELVRVPLLVSVPKLPPGRITARRSAIDIVPTILDFYGIDLPPADAPDALSGRSLLLDLVRPAGHEPATRPIFVDMPAGPHNAERQALIDGDLKLTVSGGRPLGLYDLASDPGEKKDLLDDREKAREALERFKAFRRTLREVRVRPE